MSEYVDNLGSEIIVKDANVDAFIKEIAGEPFPQPGEDRIDCLVGIFEYHDFEHTQTITDTKDGIVHCFQWVNEEGVFRGHHEDFFENIAPFVTGHIDYMSNSTPYRVLFENGTFAVETGAVRFPSSDRW